MDNTRRLQLEQLIAKGQQARVALSFFDDFEQEQKQKLWEACLERDATAMIQTRHIAQTTADFKSFLQTAVSDGMIAEKDLMMEDTRNG